MNFNPFISKFTFLFPIAYCIMLACYIGILHLGNGLLFSRVGSIASGHTLVWIIILLFAVYFRLGISNERPIYGFIQWTATMMFVIAIVELFFQVAYILNDPSRLSATLIPDLEILFGIIIGVVFKSYKMFDYKWLGFYIVFILVWFFIGLPVSVSIKNLNPMTEFYYNPMVNAIEITQWIIGLVCFAAGFKFELVMFDEE